MGTLGSKDGSATVWKRTIHPPWVMQLPEELRDLALGRLDELQLIAWRRGRLVATVTAHGQGAAGRWWRFEGTEGRPRLLNSMAEVWREFRRLGADRVAQLVDVDPGVPLPAPVPERRGKFVRNGDRWDG